MQDRYAGDVGDYGKFSLLNSLFSSSEFNLGVIWYRYPDEDHNTDGRHTGYIDEPQYKNCDTGLLEKLRLVIEGERSIAHLEKVKVLPANTVYFSEPLDFHLKFQSQTKADKQARMDGRVNWLEDAIKTVADCNIVFLDPDNGLEVLSIPNLSRMKSGKYTYYSEVTELYENKQACVIYHHLNRSKSHDSQIEHRTQELKQLVGADNSVFALRFWPYSPRVYFIIARKDIASAISKRLEVYRNGNCGVLWDSYYHV